MKQESRVTKKLAAQMVRVGRTTFYRHLSEKNISVGEDGRIDVSELIRVYGSDKVRLPEQTEQSAAKPGEHDGTSENLRLSEEIKRLKSDLENLSLERKRERDQLNDQIDHLKGSLKHSMDQNHSLTKLLTDERSEKERTSQQGKTEQEEKLEKVLKAVTALEQNQSKGWWPFRKRA